MKNTKIAQFLLLALVSMSGQLLASNDYPLKWEKYEQDIQLDTTWRPKWFGIQAACAAGTVSGIGAYNLLKSSKLVEPECIIQYSLGFAGAMAIPLGLGTYRYAKRYIEKAQQGAKNRNKCHNAWVERVNKQPDNNSIGMHNCSSDIPVDQKITYPFFGTYLGGKKVHVDLGDLEVVAIKDEYPYEHAQKKYEERVTGLGAFILGSYNVKILKQLGKFHNVMNKATEGLPEKVENKTEYPLYLDQNKMVFTTTDPNSQQKPGDNIKGDI